MNNTQIEISGVLGVEEQKNSKTSNDEVIAKTSTAQMYYGLLPSTNEYLSYYIFGLGLTICLIVVVLYRLRKFFKQV